MTTKIEELKIEELVREVDGIRAIKLADKDEEKFRIEAVEAKIFAITKGPRHHSGRGNPELISLAADIRAQVKPAVIAKLKKRIADPAWAHKKELYERTITEMGG